MSKKIQPELNKPQTEDSSMQIAHIGDLKMDKNNPRKHTPRNIGVIVDSLQELGAMRSIVIDEDNNILSGNGTIEAAGEAGIHKVRIIECEGDEIIAVRRSNLDPRQKMKAKVVDNRAAELAIWDTEEMAAMAETDATIFEGMFYDKELDRLLQTAGDNLPDFQPGDGAPMGDNGRLRDGQAVSTEGLAISSVQLVQLLYKPDQKAVFDDAMRVLGRVFKTDNPSDTVLALVADALTFIAGEGGALDAARREAKG